MDSQCNCVNTTKYISPTKQKIMQKNKSAKITKSTHFLFIFDRIYDDNIQKKMDYKTFEEPLECCTLFTAHGVF